VPYSETCIKSALKPSQENSGYMLGNLSFQAFRGAHG
jgi:hypothetical protein